MRKLLLVPILLCGGLLGADAGPAMPPMDFSTPRAALTTYFTLVAYGDLDALRKVSTVPTSDAEKQMALVGRDASLWVPHLIVAMQQYFPKGQLTNIPDPRLSVPGYKAVVGNMVLTEAGDTATLRQKPDPDHPPAADAEDMKIVLKKEAGEWKIVLKDSNLIPCFQNPTAKQIEFSMAMRDCYADTATDILAGKFTSPILASKACDDRIKALQQKYLHPTTVPAGK